MNVDQSRLLRRGRRLEWATLAWNVVGIGVLAFAAISARSVALAGFGIDSVIEIGASTVVLWELSGRDGGHERERRALRLIGVAFLGLVIYLLLQTTIVLAVRHHAAHSPLGIVWTAATALVMFVLATGKARTGRSLASMVLQTEGRVTFVDGLLATSVLIGLILNTTLAWWWADPISGLVIAGYGLREGRSALRSSAR